MGIAEVYMRYVIYIYVDIAYCLLNAAQGVPSTSVTCCYLMLLNASYQQIAASNAKAAIYTCCMLSCAVTA
jgi:hypothetical protein